MTSKAKNKRYKQLATTMVNEQAKMMEKLLAHKGGGMDIDDVAIAAYSASVASIIMTLAGAISCGDKKIYKVAIEAATGVIDLTLRSADRVFENGTANIGTKTQH